MYEELVKSLRLCGRMINADDNCIAYYDGSCERWPVCAYDLMKQAADAIEKLQKTLADHDELLHAYRHVCNGLSPDEVQKRISRPRWISVEERLPEEHEWVLVYSRLVKPMTDFIDKTGNWYKTPAVTHWMPLPEPPKEET